MSGLTIACGGCGSRRVRARGQENSLPDSEPRGGHQYLDCRWQGAPQAFPAAKAYQEYLQRR